MKKLFVLLFLLIACNDVELVSVPSPVPLASPAPTITPPPCPVGPAPVWALGSPNGNWDYTIGPTIDPRDQDLDVYIRVWKCTADPNDLFPPHELQISLDLDDPAWACPIGVSPPCPVYITCCQ